MASTGEPKKMIRCIECANGKFMQWFDNPVVCECSIRTVIRFVANARKICSDFKPSNNPNPEITHYDTYEETAKMFKKRVDDEMNLYIKEELELMRKLDANNKK